MSSNTTTTAEAATLTKFDHYLVSEVKDKPGIPGVFDGRPETVEMLPGSFLVERLANATVVIRSHEDDLPFRGVRLTCGGYVPVTVYVSDEKCFRISDNPEPGITVDHLDDGDRAYVWGRRSAE